MPAPALKDKVRIIGGQWRGRNIAVPTSARPTPDRVRETLFNWLQADVVDAVCLDLFAGSGALGFEALSRGAAHVTLVDVDKNSIAHLTQMQSVLKIDDQCQIIRAQLPCDLKITQPINLIFVDPPFQANLYPKLLPWIANLPFLAQNCLIYLESPAQLPLSLPTDWVVHKQKRAGQVDYTLALKRN